MDPLTVDYKLRYGALAGAPNDFVDGAGGSLDVDLFVRNVVLGEKALRFAAVRAPGS